MSEQGLMADAKVRNTVRTPKRAPAVLKLKPASPPQPPQATTQTFELESLPPRQECANCTELRKLLASMRSRVDEVEREYHLLMERVDAGANGAAAPSAIEIVSDLPTSNHSDG